jgi:hypothetical protein
MATIPGDPRASGFDAPGFRDAIKFAMKMGLPEDTAERPTFRWKAVKTFTSADPAGNPYNRKAAPITNVQHADVQIDCAVEFISRSTLGGGTPAGDFETPRAIITVMDVDYPDVDGATEILLGGNTYHIDFVAPPTGLFGATVYQIHASAESES